MTWLQPPPLVPPPTALDPSSVLLYAAANEIYCSFKLCSPPALSLQEHQTEWKRGNFFNQPTPSLCYFSRAGGALFFLNVYIDFRLFHILCWAFFVLQLNALVLSLQLFWAEYVIGLNVVFCFRIKNRSKGFFFVSLPCVSTNINGPHIFHGFTKYCAHIPKR